MARRRHGKGLTRYVNGMKYRRLPSFFGRVSSAERVKAEIEKGNLAFAEADTVRGFHGYFIWCREAGKSGKLAV